ncbi:hypothetical protein ABT263_13005 [Kitasatospora sp. NPDC001603]|uniref:hypothetical protein n=1 Tax=Kitasatospora sp. NPDC001603 TaxID=3154388 RepID=UPI0033240921
MDGRTGAVGTAGVGCGVAAGGDQGVPDGVEDGETVGGGLPHRLPPLPLSSSES